MDWTFPVQTNYEQSGGNLHAGPMRRVSRQHAKKSSFWRFFLCTAVFVPVFFSWSLFQGSDKAAFSLSASATRGKQARDRGIIFDRNLQVLARDRERPVADPVGDADGAFERTYPQGRLASHLIGFSRDNEGLAGLEFSFDPALSGQYFPESLPETGIVLPPESSRHGFHLITTLSLTAQKHLENVLAPEKADGSITVSGALLHVDSGEILALSSMPAFDPNRFWNGPAALHVNHFLQDTLPLGAFADLIRRAVIRQQADATGENAAAADAFPTDLMVRFAATHLGLDRHLLPELTMRHFFTPTQQTGLLHLAGTRIAPLELLTIVASLAGGRPVTPRLTASLVDRQNGRVLQPHLQQQPSPPPTLLPALLELPWTLSNIQQDSPGAAEGQENATGCATAGLFTTDGDLYLALIVATGLPASQARGVTENKMEHFIASLRKTARLRPPLPRELPFLTASSLPGSSRRAESKRDASRQYRTASGKTAMPQVTGLSLREGLARLSGLALEIAIQGNGTIVSQLPAPGAHIAGPTRCRLTLAATLPASSMTAKP